jgi:hypothetical protein
VRSLSPLSIRKPFSNEPSHLMHFSMSSSTFD